MCFFILCYSGKTHGTGVVFTCGGSVINNYYILTAAHCFLNGNPSMIALGEHDLNKKKDRKGPNGKNAADVIHRGVEKIILHEGYDPDLQGGAAPNDIALIRVNESIPLFDGILPPSKIVSPICLPWKRNDTGRELDSNTTLKVLGWGYTTNDPIDRIKAAIEHKAGTSVQQQLDVPFLDWEECNEKANFPPGWKVNRETLMCAGGQKGEDSCNGDSGGPLISRDSIDDPWFQVGVVSFGARECGNGTPGFYTKVAEFLPWIEKNLEP